MRGRARQNHRPVWPKPPVPRSDVLQRLHRGELGVLDPLDDQLGDAVAPAHLVVGVRVGVDQQHPQLVAVAGVDQAGGVEARDAVAQRQAAAGLDEPGVALGDGEGDAGGHQRPPRRRRQDRALAGHEVGAGVAGPGVGRQGQVGVEADDGDAQHGRHCRAEAPDGGGV